MGNAWTIRCVTLPLAAETTADGKRELPRRFKFLNWGDNPNLHDKRVVLGPAAVRAAAHPLNVWKRIPLDFEHNTLEGTAAFKETREPREIAGYGDVEIVPGDGAYLANIAYTAAGLSAAPNYACVSGAPVCDPDGNVILFQSVALCRNSAVPGMAFESVPLSAGAAGQVDQIVKAPEQTTNMDYKAELCRQLGLDPAVATDEEITAALAKRKADAKPPAPTDANPVPLSAQIATAVGLAVKPIADQVAQVNLEFQKRDKDAVLAEARAAGKVVPLSADAIAALSLAQLQDVVKATPATVPLSARTPASLPENQPAAGPTADQAAIARNCGVDAAAVWPKKSGGISIRLALGLAAVASFLGFVAVATAAERDTPERSGRRVVVTAGAAVEAGHMAAVSNGVAYPAADLAGYVVIGRFDASAAAGATVAVRRGVFRWANDGAFTDADIGIRCYVSTNAASGSYSVTTLAIAANDIPAGYIVDVDDEGVWVDTYNDSPLISTSVASLGIVGNATVGGTLGVTGAATLSNAAIVFSALPTATNGLTDGRLWNSSGTVKVYTVE